MEGGLPHAWLHNIDDVIDLLDHFGIQNFSIPAVQGLLNWVYSINSLSTSGVC